MMTNCLQRWIQHFQMEHFDFLPRHFLRCLRFPYRRNRLREVLIRFDQIRMLKSCYCQTWSCLQIGKQKCLYLHCRIEKHLHCRKHFPRILRFDFPPRHSLRCRCCLCLRNRLRGLRMHLCQMLTNCCCSFLRRMRCFHSMRLRSRSRHPGRERTIRQGKCRLRSGVSRRRRCPDIRMPRTD